MTSAVFVTHAEPALAPHGLSWLRAWDLSPSSTVTLGAATALYLWAYRRVPAFPRRRLVYFGLGLVALGISLVSPVAAYDDTLFWDHMLQHMIMANVAAPLLP